MEFGWINLFGAGIIVLIMIPNIIYAAGQKQDETQIEVPRGLSACECYYLSWMLYSRKKTLSVAMALAIIPTAIFLLSGILLQHWLLVAFAILFGACHCTITYMTHKEC